MLDRGLIHVVLWENAVYQLTFVPLRSPIRYIYDIRNNKMNRLEKNEKQYSYERSSERERSSDRVNDNYNVDVVPHQLFRQVQGQGMNRQDVHEKYGKDVTVSTTQSSEKPLRKVERSNSRVTKVSNLIRWPKKQEKDKNGFSVSDSSQV